jgi:hypothetical protein
MFRLAGKFRYPAFLMSHLPAMRAGFETKTMIGALSDRSLGLARVCVHLVLRTPLSRFSTDPGTPLFVGLATMMASYQTHTT